MSAISPDLNRRKGPEVAAMRRPDGGWPGSVTIELDDGADAAGPSVLDGDGAEPWEAIAVPLGRGTGPFRRLPPPRPEDYDW